VGPRLYGAYVDAVDPRNVRPQELSTADADRECGEDSGVYAERGRAGEAAIKALPAESMRSMAMLAHRRSVAADKARAILDAG
jgi:hypothetical protein